MLTTGHTCAAPGDGAEPGEQPGKAAEQVRNGSWVGETREGAEEAERQKGEEGRREPQTERQTGQGSEKNTLHIVFHFPEMATATTPVTTAAATAARTLQ